MIQDKLDTFIKRLSESTPSCLMMMVQGNAFAITIDHWLKALQVGGMPDLLAVLVSFSGRQELQDNKFVLAGLTGFLTAVSDFALHQSHFGGPSTEAIATGIGAGLLCLALSTIRSK